MTRIAIRLTPTFALLALLLCGLAIAYGITSGKGDVIAYVAWDNVATTSQIELLDLHHGAILPRFSVFGRIDDVDWSPDGETLYFAAYRQEEIRRDIIALDVVSGRWRWLTSGPADHNTPDIAEDGTQLIISRNDRSGGNWDLAILDAASGDFLGLVVESRFRSEGRPDWSPNGDLIAYQISGYIDVPLLIVADVESGVTVWEGAGITPAWSPDGRTLAYIASSPGLANINLLDIDSQRSHNLTQGERREAFPTWSPDGRRLVFSAATENTATAQLYIVNRDGSGLRRLTHHNLSHLYPAWKP